MLLAPTGSWVDSVACRLSSRVPVPSAVVPSRNCTVVPVAASFSAVVFTVAVKDTVCPSVGEVGDTLTVSSSPGGAS